MYAPIDERWTPAPASKPTLMLMPVLMPDADSSHPPSHEQPIAHPLSTLFHTKFPDLAALPAHKIVLISTHPTRGMRTRTRIRGSSDSRLALTILTRRFGETCARCCSRPATPSNAFCEWVDKL
ncbi:hypothetical protein IE81DRAFT_257494 [Ceraceosorus guamensis]|uniref:Uncharacterized protein n=1 Tax=Ceraceosorus guamensis TaxID=1522189 RepID=A0A316VR24_9BASI|nr:hypothetical protein IE81DRAFT_257494 [Ceraceosorus guamensis]PWN39800.1 hypothetical protein IE81DRAFT_257494 [Ceraceosorus guamensis]